jgi:uncharacterized protein involved in exopolysaccharide biosynthesis
MMENRELTMDDYLAMLRRRIRVILIPALLAPLAGFGISYVFSAKYTSQSTVMVEGQKVPESMVQPVATEDLNQRVNSLLQVVSSQSVLKPMLQKIYGSEKSSQSIDEIIDGIATGRTFTVQPAAVDLSQIGAGKRKPGQGSVPAFTVSYTASNPREAQQICGELISLLLEENLKYIQDRAVGTSDVLNKGLEDAKRDIDGMDAKLAAFKNQHMGQLPGDEDSNMKILMGLNSQLDANTQSLNRATQDKSYTESLLAQQLAAWKTGQSSSNPQSLQQQLSQLQAQLIDLQARYTDDHPDVIKTQADIKQVKKKLAEANDTSATATDGATDKGSASEPPEIRQLRLQVHQYEDFVAQGTRDQKKLQQEIAAYQGRVASSPAVEEEYKELARDYDNAQKTYQDLLAKKSTADLTVQMNRQAQGEQMKQLDPASLPDSPSFPNRLLFAGGGLGAGLVLGLGLALWLELRDKSIRTQADAEAALDLPMLVAVPWVVETAPAKGNGDGHFWNRKKQPEEGKETAKV